MWVAYTGPVFTEGQDNQVPAYRVPVAAIHEPI